MNQGVMVGGRRPLVEDDLRWKTTSVGRRPLEEDDLWWKTTFGGRRLLVEDDLRWKTTFGGRRPMVEDDLWWKTTFGGRRSLHAAQSALRQFLCLAGQFLEHFEIFLELEMPLIC